MIEEIGSFSRELADLALVTREHAWCDGDQDCKIIAMSEYVKALTVAIILSRENPSLKMPTPGADPSGFLWLTYTKGDAHGLALEIHPDGKYRWTQNNLGDKRSFESESLNDVAQAMRTVFPQSVIIL